jgi:predicted aspartyl protease
LYKNSGVEIISNFVKGIPIVVNRNDINSFNVEDIVGASEYTEISLLQRGTIFDAQLAYDVELEINGVKGEWLLDSGAMGFTIGNIMFEKLIANGVNYKDLNKTVKSFGIGGEAYGDLVVLEEVKIGSYVVKNVVATVLDTPTSLLGTGFLLKFSNVIWNMKEKKLTIFK